MKFLEWGVFIETPNTNTYEVVLPEDIAIQVVKYLDKIKIESTDVKLKNTNGKIVW